MLKVVFKRVKNIEKKQNISSGICVSGLSIRNGTLDIKKNFLEDENVREFESEMPLLLMLIERKIITQKKSEVKGKTIVF